MQIEGTIEGRTALITGSTSGIGAGIAKGLARAGANLVINGFGERKEIEARRCSLEEEFGVHVLYSPADMTEPEEISQMLAHARKELGGVDILVNNAGIQHVSKIEDFPPEKWNEIIAINMSSSYHTIRQVIPGMREKGWGRIINLVSAHGLVASPYKSAYVTAKHGVMGLTKTVALEVAQEGITCNAICPGYVYTKLVENQIADTAKTRGISEEEVINDVLLKAQWTKKFVTIEQIAQTALFLCAPAADNITGTHISMDGGWTAA